MPQIAPFFAGIGSFLSTGAVAGAGITGAWAAGAATASFFTTTVVGKLLVSVAFSALSRALQPKPRQPGIRTSSTLTGGTTPESFILGQYATEGQMVAPPMSHGAVGKVPNAYLNYVIELGGIPGQTLAGLTIDAQPVEIGAVAHADYGLPIGGRFTGKAWIKFYDGTQIAADSMLLDKYGSDPERPWTAAMIGTGVCYAIMTFRFDREVFSGFPKVRFVLGGIPLYDPRQDTSIGGLGTQRWNDATTWLVSENPAVQVYNIMRGIRLPGGDIWGGNVAAENLPLSNWWAAMNSADVAVTLAAGGTEPQYRSAYEIYVNEPPSDIIQELLKGCSGQLVEIGGVWKLRLGGPGLPVHFFTDGEVLNSESQEHHPFPSLANTFNAVHAAYPEPDSLWETKDAPPRYNLGWEADDGGRRLVANLSLPAVPYPLQVQRLMRAYIEEERRFGRHVVTLPPEAIVLEPLDAVSWTSSRNGYTAKVFEITGIVDPIVTGKPRLSLRERDAADSNWVSAYELPSAPAPVGWTPLAAQSVPDWAVAPVSILDDAGTARRAAIELSWDGNLEDVRGIQWEIRLTSSGVVVNRGSTQDVAAGVISVSEGILPLTNYEVKAQLIVDRPTTWTAWTAVLTNDGRMTFDDLDPTVQAAIDAAAASAAADKLAAEAARDAAILAQSASEAAEANAENAQLLAANAAAASEASRLASETAKGLAEVARTAAALSEVNSAGSANQAAISESITASTRDQVIQLATDPDLTDPENHLTEVGGGGFPAGLSLDALLAVENGTDVEVGGREVIAHGRTNLYHRRAYSVDRSRRYRMRVRVKADAQSNPATANLYMGVICLNADKSSVTTYPIWNTPNWTNPNAYFGALNAPLVVGVFTEFVGEFNGSSLRQDAVFMRPLLLCNYNSSGADVGNIQRFSHFSIEDITEEYNAEQFANASATSSAIATTKASEAGVSASAAEAERVAAETAKSLAEAAEVRTAISETNAAGSESAAAISAGLAAGSESASGDSEAAAGISEANAVTAKNGAETASATAVSAKNLAVAVSSQGVGVLSDQFMPNDWLDWNTGPTRIANEIYPAGQTFSWVNTGTADSGMRIRDTFALWVGARDLDKYRVEIEFELISGSLDGAGVLFDWYGLGNNRHQMTLESMLSEPVVVGKVMLASAIFERPSSYVGPFAYHSVYAMANFSGLGVKVDKSLKFHRITIYPLTVTDAGVQTQAVAIADLEGNASSSYVMRSKAGGAVGSMEIVAASNPTGSASKIILTANELELDGLAIFTNGLESSDFVTGSVGYHLDSNGLEINNLILRGSIVDGAVSNGGVYSAFATADYRGDGVSLGALVLGTWTMDQFWQMAVNVSYRDIGYGYNVWDAQIGVGYKYYIRTRLTMQWQTFDGSVWSGWSDLHVFPDSASQSVWVTEDVVIPKLGAYNDVQLRVLVTAVSVSWGSYTNQALSGTTVTQNNILDVAYVAQAVVK